MRRANTTYEESGEETQLWSSNGLGCYQKAKRAIQCVANTLASVTASLAGMSTPSRGNDPGSAMNLRLFLRLAKCDAINWVDPFRLDEKRLGNKFRHAHYSF